MSSLSLLSGAVFLLRQLAESVEELRILFLVRLESVFDFDPRLAFQTRDFTVRAVDLDASVGKVDELEPRSCGAANCSDWKLRTKVGEEETTGSSIGLDFR